MMTILTTNLQKLTWMFALLTGLLLPTLAVQAQTAQSGVTGDVLDTVVGIDTRIPGNARTASFLGTTRQGQAW